MGTTFINTFNQNPGCAPSRTWMHTGRYSHRTGVYGFEYDYPTGQAQWRPMVPEILRDKAGYQTLAVGKLGIRAQHFANQKGGTKPPLYETNLGYRTEFSVQGLVDWNSETKWANGIPGPKNETFYFSDGTRLNWPEDPDGTPNDRAEIQRRLELLREYARATMAKTAASWTYPARAIHSTQKLADASNNHVLSSPIFPPCRHASCFCCDTEECAGVSAEELSKVIREGNGGQL